jgi:hypothetical protein
MFCAVFISQLFLYEVSTWVWCPVLSFSCCNLSVSLCFSWFRKHFPERKKPLAFLLRHAPCIPQPVCPRLHRCRQLPDSPVSIQTADSSPRTKAWRRVNICEESQTTWRHFHSAKVVLIIFEFLALGCFRQYFGLSFSVPSQAESNVNFVMSVCPAACIAARPTARIFLKFHIRDFVG